MAQVLITAYDPFATTEVGRAAEDLIKASLVYEKKRETVLGKDFTHVSNEGQLFSAAVAKYNKAVGIE